MISKKEKDRAAMIIDLMEKEIKKRPENERGMLPTIYVMPIKVGRDIIIPRYGSILNPNSAWLCGAAKIVHEYCVDRRLYPQLTTWHGEATAYLAEGEEFVRHREYSVRVLYVCPWMTRGRKAVCTAIERLERPLWISAPRQRRKGRQK